MKCSRCTEDQYLIYIELIRRVNKQSAYSNAYLCPKCISKDPLRLSAAYSTFTKHYTAAERKRRSENSRRKWKDPEARRNLLRAAAEKMTDSVRAKLSKSLKDKFKDDATYCEKVKRARRKIWRDKEYQSSRLETLEKFITTAKEIHGDKYDYEKVEYHGAKKKVIITCRSHGQFAQRPSDHIHYENGCPKCALEITESRPQKEIADFIRNLGQKVSINDTEALDGLEIDIFVPALNFGVELHGAYRHSYGTIESKTQRRKHQRKALAAIKKKVSLFQIFDYEWMHKRRIVESSIKHSLGLSDRAYARKCKVIRCNSDAVKAFFDDNHLAGYRPAKHHYCLETGGEIVCAISLSPLKDGYEIIRFANKSGMSIVGGFSRLLDAFKKDKDPKMIFTYSDARMPSRGSVYERCGFTRIGITKPGYFYWRNNKVFDRRKFQKHKLRKTLSSYDDAKTEAENMFANRYRRIWNAGNHKFIWNKP